MKSFVYVLGVVSGITVLLLSIQPVLPATIKYIYTEVEIDTPIDRVWTTLANTDDYPLWNPYHVRVDGQQTPGGLMLVEIHKPDGEVLEIRPRYLVIQPQEELTWGGGIKRIFYGKHVFRLKQVAANRTMLIHEETFSGLAVPFIPLEAIEEGYKACNKALKEYLEQ